MYCIVYWRLSTYDSHDVWISPEAREATDGASTLSSFAPPALETLSPDKI
jgi:hypothetical protein